MTFRPIYDSQVICCMPEKHNILEVNGIEFNPNSAGVDFRRQHLASVDVRFWRLKSIPALKE